MTQQYAETILNSLSAHVAIIDSNGVIIDTNKALREFAISNNPGMRPDMLNINYLKICDAANGETAGSAAQVAMGIRQVIKGNIDEFVMDYPCHSPGNKRWFYMRAVRVAGSQPLQIVVSHENITPLKIAEHKLLQREAELKQKTLGLEEANAALRALLRHRDEDLKEMEQTFFQNLKQTILPSFDQLKKLNPSGKEKKIISLIESELNNIASPFLRHISNFEAVLTPQELKIASLIKQGQSSKEIADLLNLSITTVNFHRRNLRDKLGLKNTATNLNTFLLHLN
ncbi:two component sensory box hisitidine kinase/LuxR domain protein [Desulforapulum autotrophicum HRM2]|uniref:Two component sensory box hisitidine kinase/LuxR domain protein n=1 Tax=Desulforapulum autotrophicum (strain ATCC 43914 / DSM 3382 / VKM B-1955 / HRM2) TaxID=177437 RepID=C0QMI6_DESAH|nr:PAS and helix-turn-helix domain-containing protein [Desulforapulum autotrophicum]ACN16503.1 two component sensory box hisitidine kinase/LuxR domain protein [Desulforapulum autotrophicum HRM2]